MQLDVVVLFSFLFLFLISEHLSTKIHVAK